MRARLVPAVLYNGATWEQGIRRRCSRIVVLVSSLHRIPKAGRAERSTASHDLISDYYQFILNQPPNLMASGRCYGYLIGIHDDHEKPILPAAVELTRVADECLRAAMQ